MGHDGECGLTPWQDAVKRTFDLVVGVALLVVTSPIIGVAWLLSSLDTRRNGMFRHTRVGRDGAPFDLLKIRTMRGEGGSTVTTASDVRITALGAWLRRLKIDELPQLVNVVRGEMSLVGPRPDVPGFADTLVGAERRMLTVRPGITGPAAIAFRHEQELLDAVADPEQYNREVIWPAKVALSCEYVDSWSLGGDIGWLLRTVRSVAGTRPVEESI